MTAWSDTRVTTLRTLWQDGLSASQIAKQLGGVTRNAVIGKVHRLGIADRGAASPPGRKVRRTAARPARPVRPARPSVARPSRPTPAPAAFVEPPEGPGLVFDLAGLGAHACKWPIGDPKSAGFSFCGRHAEGRYCSAHEQAATQPGKAWRVDRDPVVRRALAGLV